MGSRIVEFNQENLRIETLEGGPPGKSTSLIRSFPSKVSVRAIAIGTVEHALRRVREKRERKEIEEREEKDVMRARISSHHQSRKIPTATPHLNHHRNLDTCHTEDREGLRRRGPAFRDGITKQFDAKRHVLHHL